MFKKMPKNHTTQHIVRKHTADFVVKILNLNPLGKVFFRHKMLHLMPTQHIALGFLFYRVIGAASKYRFLN